MSKTFKIAGIRESKLMVLALSAIALIPFALSSSDPIVAPIMFVSFAPWIFWAFKLRRTALDMRTPTDANSRDMVWLAIALAMLATSAMCQMFLLWNLYVVLKFHEASSSAASTTVAFIISVVSPLISLMMLGRQMSRGSKRTFFTLILLWWLGLNLPVITVIVLSTVVYPSGFLQLYEWFFAQAIGYAIAFFGLDLASRKHASLTSEDR